MALQDQRPKAPSYSSLASNNVLDILSYAVLVRDAYIDRLFANCGVNGAR